MELSTPVTSKQEYLLWFREKIRNKTYESPVFELMWIRWGINRSLDPRKFKKLEIVLYENKNKIVKFLSFCSSIERII